MTNKYAFIRRYYNNIQIAIIYKEYILSVNHSLACSAINNLS
jgi:hypothetical protein